MPSGKMEQPLFFVLKLAGVIAMWQGGKATFILKLADVTNHYSIDEGNNICQMI